MDPIPGAIPPQVPVPEGYGLRDIQFELSLKPFFDNSAETREAVCREIFTQWAPLWRHASQISFLLWVAEGSEMLEYDGDPESVFEWARYHGAPNHHKWNVPKPRKASGDRADHNSIGVDVWAKDPERKGLHCTSYLYRPEPAEFTYGWLRELVHDLKRIGKAMTGRPILVGQAYDIGPEFAKSRFKFEWHREMLSDGPMFKEMFVSCEARLHADTRRYAAYPDGIPEGTPIGEFLGRQVRALFDACGHDFLWLSNGFGFALEPWALVGKLFDGERFHPEMAAETRERILEFWNGLRGALGEHVNIRTRGTNLCTGIDIGSDASPLEDIYRENPAVDAPVNSPWAALDADFGLELSGWMSHIAVRPGETYRFRFYTHDPWWQNSPWLDRYNRQPHDLYLPLSVSRLHDDGSAEIPRDLAFLSIDSSLGELPLQVPNEVTAYFLKARELAPDQLGPLVWVYPFQEFHQMGLEAGMPERPLHADSWVGSLINAGVPLNTVADADILADGLEAGTASTEGRLFLAPVPRPGSSYEGLIRKLMDRGAELLLFGPLFDESFLWDRLGLVPEESLSGDLELENGAHAGQSIRHLDCLSAGGWREAPGDSLDPSRAVCASRDGRRRVAFTVTQGTGSGRIGWLRASLATGEFDPENPAPIRGPILKPLIEPELVQPGIPGAEVLDRFGWFLQRKLSPGDPKPPYLTVHRHANALVLSGYHRNELSTQRVRTPLGAPLLTNRHNRLVNGSTEIGGEVAWQYEVRAFIQEDTDGVVVCRMLHPGMHKVERRTLVSGLQDNRLIILPHPDFLETLRLLPDPSFPYFLGEPLEIRLESRWGHQVILTPPLTGELLIEW